MRTGRRVARANDRSQWEEVHVPDLRIVEQPLWDAARAALAAQLAAAEAAPSPVRLHPDAASLYRTQVAELEASLFAPAIRDEAGTALRGLIERATITPDADAEGGLRIELKGDLAMILALAPGGVTSSAREGSRSRSADGRNEAAQNEKLPRTCVLGIQLSVVAGTGFEPVTFRL